MNSVTVSDADSYAAQAVPIHKEKGNASVLESLMSSAQRKKLADITNLELHAKQMNREKTNQQHNMLFSSKEYAEKLHKENMTLMKVLALRDVECQKLRIQARDLQEKNLELAQANNRILAELHTKRHRLKILQHELGCKNVLLKARKMQSEEQGLLSTHHASKDKVPSNVSDGDCKPFQAHDMNHKDTKRKRSESSIVRKEPKFFVVSGTESQRKEYHKIIRLLKGKCCTDSHQWSCQATHFITPEIRRTEKFFAAAASGSWILKTDYVADSKEAGELLPEEPYEWHSTDLCADGGISLESPRKWRLAKEQTGHGALYGMCLVVYGGCTIPSLDTLKRAVKVGDGRILATAPPYTRVFNQNIDFALISPGMPHDDVWIQEFIRHQIPCVLPEFLVEYVCKPGYELDKHILYNTNRWVERSLKKLQLSAEN